MLLKMSPCLWWQHSPMSCDFCEVPVGVGLGPFLVGVTGLVPGLVLPANLQWS